MKPMSSIFLLNDLYETKPRESLPVRAVAQNIGRHYPRGRVSFLEDCMIPTMTPCDVYLTPEQKTVVQECVRECIERRLDQFDFFTLVGIFQGTKTLLGKPGLNDTGEPRLRIVRFPEPKKE